MNVVRVQSRTGDILELGDLIHLQEWCVLIKNISELDPVGVYNEPLPFESFDTWQIKFVEALIKCYPNPFYLKRTLAETMIRRRFRITDLNSELSSDLRKTHLKRSIRDLKSNHLLHRLPEFVVETRVPYIMLYDSVWVLLEYLQCKQPIMDDFLNYVQMVFFFRRTRDQVDRIMQTLTPPSPTFMMGYAHEVSYGTKVSPNGIYTAVVNCRKNQLFLRIWKRGDVRCKICTEVMIYEPLEHMDRIQPILAWSDNSDALAVWISRRETNHMCILEQAGLGLCQTNSAELQCTGESDFKCYNIDISAHRNVCTMMWWSGDSHHLFIALRDSKYLMWSMKHGIHVISNPRDERILQFLDRATKACEEYSGLVPISVQSTGAASLFFLFTYWNNDRYTMCRYGLTVNKTVYIPDLNMYNHWIYLFPGRWILNNPLDTQRDIVFLIQSVSHRIVCYDFNITDRGTVMLAYLENMIHNRFRVEDSNGRKYDVIIDAQHVMRMIKLAWSVNGRLLVLLVGVENDIENNYGILVYSMQDIERCEVTNDSLNGVCIPPIAVTPFFVGPPWDTFNISIHNGVIFVTRSKMPMQMWILNGILVSQSGWRDSMKSVLPKLYMRGLDDI